MSQITKKLAVSYASNRDTRCQSGPGTDNVNPVHLDCECPTYCIKRGNEYL